MIRVSVFRVHFDLEGVMKHPIFNDPQRCSDCGYDKKFRSVIRSYQGSLVAENIKCQFCSECLDIREQEEKFGKQRRPVGILADISTAVWIDLPDIFISSLCGNGESSKIKLKYRQPIVENPTDSDGGETRYQFSGHSHWSIGPWLDPGRWRSSAIARKQAILILKYEFDSHSQIE